MDGNRRYIIDTLRGWDTQRTGEQEVGVVYASGDIARDRDSRARSKRNRMEKQRPK